MNSVITLVLSQPFSVNVNSAGQFVFEACIDAAGKFKTAAEMQALHAQGSADFPYGNCWPTTAWNTVTTYPPYKVAPTVATYVPMPEMLSTPADFEALIKEAGIADQVRNTLFDQADRMIYNKPQYGSETRRMLAFVYNGKEYNVGSLMVNRFFKGIGHPGHWDLADLQWINDPDTVVVAKPTWQPARALVPGEILIDDISGQQVDLASGETSGADDIAAGLALVSRGLNKVRNGK